MNVKYDFGPYQVLKKIADGTLGEVFKARQLSQKETEQRPVIIKTFNPRFVSKRDDADLGMNFIHRSFLKYHQIGQDKNTDYYYTITDPLNVEPHNADLMTKRKKKLNFKEKMLRFIDLGEAIAALHSRGSYHGALKPSNILVRFPDTEYHMVVTDFGFQYKLDEEYLEDNEKYYNSFLYMAPEMLGELIPDVWRGYINQAEITNPQDKETGGRPTSDVYSWAMLIIYSLNGGFDGFYLTREADGTPYEDHRARENLEYLFTKKIEVRDRLTLSINKKAPIDSEGFTEFIYTCLAPHPTHRYTDMNEALKVFKELTPQDWLTQKKTFY